MEEGESCVGLTLQAAWATATGGNPNTLISRQDASGGVGGTVSLPVPSSPSSSGHCFLTVRYGRSGEKIEDGEGAIKNEVDEK